MKVVSRDTQQQRRIRRGMCVKKPGERHRLATRCAWWCCGFCCNPELRAPPPEWGGRTSSLAAVIAAARMAEALSKRPLKLATMP